MSDFRVDVQPNQTLAKGILILEAFRSSQPEWGVRELARALDLSHATVFRMVRTLCNAGYLDQDEESQRYSLGPKVLTLATRYADYNPLPRVARMVFEAYADRFEHDFHLANLHRNEVVYLAVLDGRGAIRIASRPGSTIAVHATAQGKVLLAARTDDYISEFLRTAKLDSYTTRSVTDPDALWEQLREVRKEGYAINDGELYEEVAAVAVPVYSRTGKVLAGLSLAFPRHLLLTKQITFEELIPLALEISQKISERTAAEWSGVGARMTFRADD